MTESLVVGHRVLCVRHVKVPRRGTRSRAAATETMDVICVRRCLSCSRMKRSDLAEKLEERLNSQAVLRVG